MDNRSVLMNANMAVARAYGRQLLRDVLPVARDVRSDPDIQAFVERFIPEERLAHRVLDVLSLVAVPVFSIGVFFNVAGNLVSARDMAERGLRYDPYRLDSPGP